MLDTRPKIVGPASPRQPLGGIRGSVVLTDVEFSFPGAQRPVLQGISFTADPGTTTAIVGGTGSGKSTLVSVICRMHDVTAG